MKVCSRSSAGRQGDALHHADLVLWATGLRPIPNALRDNENAEWAGPDPAWEAHCRHRERRVAAAGLAIEQAEWALEAEHARRDAVRHVARGVLAEFRDAGLRRRAGRALTRDDLKVLERLLARGLGEPEMRACTELGCGVVFKAKPRSPTQESSVRCPRCRDSRATRPDPRPHHGPNPFMEVGSPDDPGSRRITYEALCAECGHGLTASRPNTRFCLDCRGGAGRVRRHRGGGSARRTFRYAHREGAQEFTVSVTRGYGEQILLQAVGGAIRTTDLEVVKVLDQYVRFGELRRVPVR